MWTGCIGQCTSWFARIPSRHAFSRREKEESSTARSAIQPSPGEKSCAGSLNFILECRRLVPELAGCLKLAFRVIYTA